MISLRMGSSSLEQIKGNQAIMDEPESDHHRVGLDSVSPSSSEVCSIESDQDSDNLSDNEEATSPASSSSPPSFSSSSSSSSSSSADATFSGLLQPDPLQDMSALMQQLPIKRGLSKYFQGKSQSFTSLSNVRSLEDLAKPENPYNKKLKSCKSYGGGLSEGHHRSTNHHLPRTSSSSRFISKKTSSRGSCSLPSAKRNVSFLGNRPPIPSAHRSTSTSSISNQTPLFA